MRALIGTKVGMTNLFGKNGKMYATTIIHVEPNLVLGVKTKDKNGFNAIQLAYDEIKEKAKNKPDLGQFKKIKASPRRIIKEFKDVDGYNVGDLIKCDLFKKGDVVNVIGTSKGHGFTGSIKRHNFSVGPLGHGAGYPHRYVGSISGGRGGSQAQRVFKGTELPGHYGHERVTMSNLLILDVIPEKNLILVKGSIPGPKNAYVSIIDSKKAKLTNELIELIDINNKKQETKVETQDVVVEETKQEAIVESNVEKTEEVKEEVAQQTESKEE